MPAVLRLLQCAYARELPFRLVVTVSCASVKVTRHVSMQLIGTRPGSETGRRTGLKILSFPLRLCHCYFTGSWPARDQSKKQPSRTAANRANIPSRHGYRCFSPSARLGRGPRPQVLHWHGRRDALHSSDRLLADVLSRLDIRSCENYHRARSERNRAPARAAVHVVAGAVHRADELGRDAPSES